EIGHVSEMNNVCYRDEIGVERTNIMYTAFEYYQKSVEMVGWQCEKRIRVGKDEFKAFQYYKKSADMYGWNYVI
ncbi:8293_t:CDS:1, partial [Acaulospora morrowiae]